VITAVKKKKKKGNTDEWKASKAQSQEGFLFHIEVRTVTSSPGRQKMIIVRYFFIFSHFCFGYSP